MKFQSVTLCFCMLILILSCSEKKEKIPDLQYSPKEVLLKQLKTTHTQKEWFVPVNIALEGLTAEQAMWRDSSGNHSAGQLAHHLLFWNKILLRKFVGDSIPQFTGNTDNKETFTAFDQRIWQKTVSELDSVLTEFEKAIAVANEEKLTKWYETLANMNTHNAYHTGQIVYLRKLQKSWDPEKGVK